MTTEERLVADFDSTGITLGPHPMAYHRAEMNAAGVLPAASLRGMPDGTYARIAGAVIARQRPGAAEGFIFLSLEDETGISNAIINPQLYERNRITVTRGKFLRVDGTLQNQDGVVNVRADPVRVFEDFSFLDLISHGRAELIVGRGVFTEPFPLLGFDLNDYHELFEEKLDLLQRLNQAERITWSGQFRSPLRDAEISPRPHQAQLPLWVGVGGTPESAVRAGELGLPMALAVLGGPISRIASIVTLYRKAGQRAGHLASKLKVSINSHAYIGEDSLTSRNLFLPHYQHYMSEFLPSGRRPTQLSRSDFAFITAPTNGLMVGSVQEVIDKIMAEYETVHHDRFLAQIDVGGLPCSEVAKIIERFGDRVAPVIRKETMAETVSA
jgi:alkanesulfonate monooxygenase SsuD/methylene tetrahydromethanopterin reductase-like flavin-dependent oxidoreductase (luciferase family)